MGPAADHGRHTAHAHRDAALTKELSPQASPVLSVSRARLWVPPPATARPPEIKVRPDDGLPLLFLPQAAQVPSAFRAKLWLLTAGHGHHPAQTRGDGRLPIGVESAGDHGAVGFQGQTVVLSCRHGHYPRSAWGKTILTKPVISPANHSNIDLQARLWRRPAATAITPLRPDGRRTDCWSCLPRPPRCRRSQGQAVLCAAGYGYPSEIQIRKISH